MMKPCLDSDCKHYINYVEKPLARFRCLSCTRFMRTDNYDGPNQARELTASDVYVPGEAPSHRER